MEDEEEGSEDEDDPFDNKEGGDEYLLLLHSYNNDRATHMMGNKTVSNESFMIEILIPYSFSTEFCMKGFALLSLLKTCETCRKSRGTVKCRK